MVFYINRIQKGIYQCSFLLISKDFRGVDHFSILRIRDVRNMIKGRNLVPNYEACLGVIQQCKLKLLVGWSKDIQSHGLAIILPDGLQQS